MKKQALETFWNMPQRTQPLERRIRFGDGELRISLLPEQPVPHLGAMSSGMIEAAIVEAATGLAVAPQLVFGPIRQRESAAVVETLDGNRFPVVQLGSSPADRESLDYQQQMKQAAAATGPAQVAPGDHAVGFIYRIGGADMFFYPLLAVATPEEIAAYHDGSVTTTDVIPLLPFQS